MNTITLPMQPDYYKETMKAMFEAHGINPVLFVGYRVDSGHDPFAPKLIPLENLARVVKLNSPSENIPVEKVCKPIEYTPIENIPVEKFSDFGSRRVIDRSFVDWTKKHYQYKEK